MFHMKHKQYINIYMYQCLFLKFQNDHVFFYITFYSRCFNTYKPTKLNQLMIRTKFNSLSLSLFFYTNSERNGLLDLWVKLHFSNLLRDCDLSYKNQFYQTTKKLQKNHHFENQAKLCAVDNYCVLLSISPLCFKT